MDAVSDRKHIACLHAHHGNIAYLDETLAPFQADVSHFVDPALVRRIGTDPGFGEEDAGNRVAAQLRWMAESGVDGIVVTCTAYVAATPPGPMLGVDVPILPIDEPFFAAVCRSEGPRAILFTNPGTVDGTMRRLNAYAAERGVTIDPTVDIIPDAFELFMAGRQAEHDAVLAERLTVISKDGRFKSVFAAQLSMTNAARSVVAGGHGDVHNPLDALSAEVGGRLGIARLDGRG